MKTNLVFLLFLLLRCLQARKPYSNIVKDVQVLDLNAQFDIFLCNFDFHIKLHCLKNYASNYSLHLGQTGPMVKPWHLWWFPSNTVFV